MIVELDRMLVSGRARAVAKAANQAQCAMCRTQLENNVSNGNPGLAAGLNTGILYLLSVPYLAIMVLGYFWYKSSKRNESGKLATGTSAK